MLLPEDGDRPPKHVEAKIVYFLYIICIWKLLVFNNEKYIILHVMHSVQYYIARNAQCQESCNGSRPDMLRMWDGTAYVWDVRRVTEGAPS